jgi:chloramphenicol O-acetyltransferase type A
MPVSIHVHHALADGRDIGEYLEHFQKLLDDEY